MNHLNTKIRPSLNPTGQAGSCGAGDYLYVYQLGYPDRSIPASEDKYAESRD